MSSPRSSRGSTSAVYELIRDYLDGGLELVPRELTLADGAVDYSTTGDNLSPATIATLEALRAEITSGKRTVPRAPSGPLDPPSSVTVTQTATVTFDGADCRYQGPTDLVSSDVVHVRFTNESTSMSQFGVWPNGRSDLGALQCRPPRARRTRGTDAFPRAPTSHSAW